MKLQWKQIIHDICAERESIRQSCAKYDNKSESISFDWLNVSSEWYIKTIEDRFDASMFYVTKGYKR